MIANPPSLIGVADMADEANDRIDAEMHSRLRARAAERLSALRCESADNCAECGEQIPSGRQLAVPGCTLCVECASALD